MNAAARLIYGLRHSDHISDALISLHWLRAQERVRFKTAVLMYKATNGTVSSYLSQLVRGDHGRPRIGANGVRWKMDEKLKSENMQKQQFSEYFESSQGRQM